MKVLELVEKTGWKTQASSEAFNREVSNVVVGDLLSWVMGNGHPNAAWITVQVHMNILAIAKIRDFSCIIIAEGARVSEEVCSMAYEMNIALIQCSELSFECARKCIECGF